jgi:hypothetical protein
MSLSTASYAITTEKFSTVGSFDVVRAYDGNDYTRCYATLGSGRTMVRFGYSIVTKQFAITVPGNRKFKGVTMYVEPLDGDDLTFPAESDGTRTWAFMGVRGAQQLERFLRVRDKITVHIDNASYNFPIGKTSMTEVANQLQQCVK